MLSEFVIPDHSLLDLRRRMERFFSSLTPEMPTESPFNSLSGILPATNIWENDQSYYIEMAAPGVQSDQIELSLVGNDLTVQLKRPEIDENLKCGKYLRQERLNQSSSVSITLPAGVNSKEIQAEVEQGILLIEIPKAESAQVKKINVQSK